MKNTKLKVFAPTIVDKRKIAKKIALNLSKDKIVVINENEYIRGKNKTNG